MFKLFRKRKRLQQIVFDFPRNRLVRLYKDGTVGDVENIPGVVEPAPDIITEEDLVIGEPIEHEEGAAEDEAEFEIAAEDQGAKAFYMCSIYETFRDMDTLVLNETQKRNVTRTRKRCLDLVHKLIKEIYDEEFDEDKTEEKQQP